MLACILYTVYYIPAGLYTGTKPATAHCAQISQMLNTTYLNHSQSTQRFDTLNTWKPLYAACYRADGTENVREHLLNKDSRGRTSSGERAGAAIWAESNWGQNRAIKCLAGWVVGGGHTNAIPLILTASNFKV